MLFCDANQIINTFKDARFFDLSIGIMEGMLHLDWRVIDGGLSKT